MTFDPTGVPDSRCGIVLQVGVSTFNVTVSSVTGTVDVSVED